MAIKINYKRVNEIACDMVDSLNTFQGDLNRFKTDVNNYSVIVQDAISQSAIDVCDDIERLIKETQALIKDMSEKVGEGMEQINNVEIDLGGKIKNV